MKSSQFILLVIHKSNTNALHIYDVTSLITIQLTSHLQLGTAHRCSLIKAHLYIGWREISFSCEIIMRFTKIKWKMTTVSRSNGKLARRALTNPKLEEAFQAHGQSGHRFEKKTFTRPTYCHHCTDLLWGLTNQGLICEGKLFKLDGSN